MKNHTVAILILISLFINQITAQENDLAPTRYGIGIGLGASTISGIDGKTRPLTFVPGTDIYYENGLSAQYALAGNLDIVLQLNPTKRFFIQSETSINFIGSIIRASTSSERKHTKSTRILLSYATQSLYFGIRKPVKDSKYWVLLGAAPYIAYDLDDTAKIVYSYFEEDDYYDEEWEEEASTKSLSGKKTVDLDDTYLRQWDWGFYLMAGMEYKNFQLTIRPQFGMSNLTGEQGYNLRNRAWKINCTFFF